MSEQPTTMSCTEFRAQMAELIGSGEAADHPHLKECELCREFLESLESIATAARLLYQQEVEPPDELWKRLERAIEKDEAETSAGTPAPDLAM